MDNNYYRHVLKYIYQNPTKVNIVTNCKHYQFSTLNYFIYNKALPFKLYNPIIGDKHQFIKYINTPEDDLYKRKMDFATSRPIFTPPSKRTLQRKKSL